MSDPVDQAVQVDFDSSQGGAGAWSFAPNPVELKRGQSTVTYSISGWNFRAISIARLEEDSDQGFIDARSGDAGKKITSSDGLFSITLTTFSDDSIVLDLDVSLKLESRIVLGVVMTVGKNSQRRSSHDPQIVLTPDGP